MDERKYSPGDVLLLGDGSKLVVLVSSRNEDQILARYLEVPGDASLAGREVLVDARAVTAFTPAPPDSSWGEKVIVIVHHVPESEETEEGYEAVAIAGIPLGVSVTASDPDTAHAALDRLLGALKTFGYTGTVAVEDTTYLGHTHRYELGVS